MSEQFKNELRAFVERNNMNKTTCAQLFGVPYSTFISWDKDISKGGRNPSAVGERILEIFKILEVMNPAMLKSLIEVAENETA